MPHDIQTEGCGRGGGSLDQGQAAPVAGPKPLALGSHEEGVEAEGRRETPQKPLCFLHTSPRSKRPEKPSSPGFSSPVQSIPSFEIGPSLGTN